MAGIGANSLGAIQNPGSPSGRLESFPVQGALPRQPSPEPTAGVDRGLWLSLRAIRRRLAAMPHDLFLIRLIHHATRRPFPGERLWTGTQLLNPAIVRFLRIRNREGLSYGANSGFRAPAEGNGARFSATASSNPANTPKVEASFREVGAE